MRLLPFLVALGVTAAAQAQVETKANFYYAERGHWTVAIFGKACRAFNRPVAELNASPYNALAIVARPGGEIAVEVFFWPGAVTAETDYQLTLTFGSGGAIVLPARATFADYMVASVPDTKLWRLLQDATDVRATVGGQQYLDLFFGLDDVTWVLSQLTSCVGYLPKE